MNKKNSSFLHLKQIGCGGAKNDNRLKVIIIFKTMEFFQYDRIIIGFPELIRFASEVAAR